MGQKFLRILLADDHKIMREGLRSLLGREQGLKIVGEAEDGRMAVSLAQTLKPDIVILDIGMPDLNGIEAARQIREGAPQAKIIALSMHADKRFISGMLGAGACGYLLKDCASEELVAAIQTVAEKGTYLSARIAGVLVKDYLNQPTLKGASVFSVLTSRQCEVLQLLAEGKNSKHIAFQLNISIKTVETHIQNIMQKLEIHSIAELTKYAIREGLTSIDT
jgi:DNA-binding NarL/FixJ family response regulator